MMIIPTLALRNLFRVPRRTILAMSAIVIGIGVFVLGESFVSGIEENVRISSIEGLNGHVLIQPADYPSEGFHPVDQLLELNDETREFLDTNSRAWTERILFSPTVSSGADHLRVRAIGYDPVKDPKVFSRNLWNIRGREPDANRNEIMITTGLSNLLNLKEGESLTVQVRTHKGAMNAMHTEISGIVSTGMSHIDTAGILLPLQLARNMINAEFPTHVAVRIFSRNESGEFSTQLKKTAGSEFEIITWQEDAEDLLGAQAIRRRALQFISAILLLLAGFGLANTILMAAHERIREIGTLRSMGMSQRGVTGLFLVEGLLLGLAGSILGALWGGIGALYWMYNPIDMSKLTESMGDGNMAFSALVYSEFSPVTITAGIIFGVVVSILASIYPARAALKMAPADAVRAE